MMFAFSLKIYGHLDQRNGNVQQQYTAISNAYKDKFCAYFKMYCNQGRMIYVCNWSDYPTIQCIVTYYIVTYL